MSAPHVKEVPVKDTRIKKHPYSMMHNHFSHGLSLFLTSKHVEQRYSTMHSDAPSTSYQHISIAFPFRVLQLGPAFGLLHRHRTMHHKWQPLCLFGILNKQCGTVRLHALGNMLYVLPFPHHCSQNSTVKPPSLPNTMLASHHQVTMLCCMSKHHCPCALITVTIPRGVLGKQTFVVCQTQRVSCQVACVVHCHIKQAAAVASTCYLCGVAVVTTYRPSQNQKTACCRCYYHQCYSYS